MLGGVIPRSVAPAQGRRRHQRGPLNAWCTLGNFCAQLCQGLQGGPEWHRCHDFYTHMFGCASFEESAARTSEAIEAADAEDAVVVVAHNGPTGLGSSHWSICGKDFVKEGGDFGDLDLRLALDAAASNASRCAGP